MQEAQKEIKLTLKSLAYKPSDINKNLLKSKVNPTEIKVRITSLKLLRDRRVMIEASSNNEIQTPGGKIVE